MPLPMPGGRVLIVDDESANVSLLERILRRHGYQHLTSTTDPTEVVKLFATVQPDIVLLDLHMPHLDGIALMGQLNAVIDNDDFIPMVVLTADNTSDAMTRALTAGANDFLTKPFDITEVVLRIGNLLTTRALHLRIEHHRLMLARQLSEHETAQRQHAAEQTARTLRIRDVLNNDQSFHMLFQPIVDLPTGRIVGAEALARFNSEPSRTPDLWFAEADSVGLGIELEVAAVTAAVAQIPQLPAGTYLSINASPATVNSGALLPILHPDIAPRVILELTEHVQIDDYTVLCHALDGLRDRGVRIAVDDAGSGFAGLHHILRLTPDLIKLDLILVRDINTDPVRRALASALVTFTADTGAALVAEGIETQAELHVLTDLGVGLGQGYLLGRPQFLPLTPWHLSQTATDPNPATNSRQTEPEPALGYAT